MWISTFQGSGEFSLFHSLFLFLEIFASCFVLLLLGFFEG
jgi:hypothetical protein